MAALVIVEKSQAREVVSLSVKSELPDINIAVTALASELFALTVGLYRGVKTVWKNATGSLSVPGALRNSLPVQFASQPPSPTPHHAALSR